MGGRMAVGSRLSARTIVLDATTQLWTIQEYGDRHAIRLLPWAQTPLRMPRLHAKLPLRVPPCRPRAVGTHEAPQVWRLHSRQEEWKRLRRTSHDLRGYKQPPHHVFKTCDMTGLEPS